MRKYLTGILTAALVLMAVLPLKVSAGGQDALYLEAEGEGVKVRLALPGADGQMLSSLQLTLKVTSDTAERLEAAFQFEEALTGKTKVCEARYQAESGTLNLYIAGREPLFARGEETLTLGRVVAEGGSFTVEAEEDALTLAEGSSKRTAKLGQLPAAVLAGDQREPGDGTETKEHGEGEETPSVQPPAGDENLQQSVNAAKGYVKKNYTKESYAALEEAVKNAEGVLGNLNASQEERDEALKSLQNAAGALEDQTLTSTELMNSQNGSSQEEELFKEPAPVVLYVMIAVLILVIAGITVYGIYYKRKEEIIRK